MGEESSRTFPSRRQWPAFSCLSLDLASRCIRTRICRTFCLAKSSVISPLILGWSSGLWLYFQGSAASLLLGQSTADLSQILLRRLCRDDNTWTKNGLRSCCGSWAYFGPDLDLSPERFLLCIISIDTKNLPWSGCRIKMLLINPVVRIRMDPNFFADPDPDFK